MLGQQPRGFERLQGAPVLARGFQPQAQRQGAALRPLRQFREPRQGGRRVAVVERPTGGTQLHALAYFRRHQCATIGALVECLLKVRIARRAILQRLRALGGQQMRHHADLKSLRQPGIERGQPPLLRQRRLRRLARAREPARQQLRSGVEQRRMQRALLLLQTPLARLLGQREQCREAPQRQVQQHEHGEQKQQHQVERQVDPPGRPEDGDRALVVAGEQRHRGGDAEQSEEPEDGAHGFGPA